MCRHVYEFTCVKIHVQLSISFVYNYCPLFSFVHLILFQPQGIQLPAACELVLRNLHSLGQGWLKVKDIQLGDEDIKMHMLTSLWAEGLIQVTDAAQTWSFHQAGRNPWTPTVSFYDNRLETKYAVGYVQETDLGLVVVAPLPYRLRTRLIMALNDNAM